MVQIQHIQIQAKSAHSNSSGVNPIGGHHFVADVEDNKEIEELVCTSIIQAAYPIMNDLPENNLSREDDLAENNSSGEGAESNDGSDIKAIGDEWYTNLIWKEQNQFTSPTCRQLNSDDIKTQSTTLEAIEKRISTTYEYNKPSNPDQGVYSSESQSRNHKAYITDKDEKTDAGEVKEGKESILSHSSTQNNYKKLLFCLVFFHSLLLERRKFDSLGWNIPYTFTQSYFKTSSLILKNMLYLTEQNHDQTTAAAEIPWNALKYLIFMTSDFYINKKVAPSVARLVENWENDNDSDEHERKIDARLIELNDILEVPRGSKCPCDGIIISGISSMDASLITGESMSVQKEIGDEIIGATVNLSNTIYIRVNKIGNETILSKIITLVENAQSSRAPIQNLANIIASRFVPVVIFISFVVFIGWYIGFETGNIKEEGNTFTQSKHSSLYYSFLFGISVLVISCPCAL